MEWNLSHTMMPGVVTMVMMLLAVALTADQLVTEKEEGLLTRDYVCGVGVPVYLAAQISVSYIVLRRQVFSSCPSFTYLQCIPDIVTLPGIGIYD